MYSRSDTLQGPQKVDYIEEQHHYLLGVPLGLRPILDYKGGSLSHDPAKLWMGASDMPSFFLCQIQTAYLTVCLCLTSLGRFVKVDQFKFGVSELMPILTLGKSLLQKMAELLQISQRK